MEFSYAFYPPFWKNKAWRKQVLEAANKRCQLCGRENRVVAMNTDGEPFMIYLQIAHKDQYLTWHPQAETMVLCQPCHRRFDKQNIRRDKEDFALSVIGQARISAIYKRRLCLVGVVTTMNELRDVVSVQPVGTVLIVELEVNQRIVGRGRYVKTQRSVEVMRETGAARSLWTNFVQKRSRRKLMLLNAVSR